MDELTFAVEEAPEGGYTARALWHSIFTEADSIPQLHKMVRDAVCCYFDEGKAPKVIRLHFAG
ncbi:MAG: 2-oxoisovalerate dehydrogenase [Bryobacterales bacterium]|nr:2-oxoisovalerate dehydrogenase [Bryobacterales bacterium]